jgi:hypothetical protein
VRGVGLCAEVGFSYLVPRCRSLPEVVLSVKKRLGRGLTGEVREKRLGLVRGGRSLRRGRVLGTLRTKSSSAFRGSTLSYCVYSNRGDTTFQEGRYYHNPMTYKVFHW